MDIIFDLIMILSTLLCYFKTYGLRLGVVYLQQLLYLMDLPTLVLGKVGR
jgi:hypothetical protein